MTEYEWSIQTRVAIRKLNIKRRQHGHSSKAVPWTYLQFASWFREHYEKGVNIGVHLLAGDYPKLLSVCRAGMCVPDWATVRLFHA